MSDDTEKTQGARLLITSSALLAAAAALGIAGIGLATVAVGAIARRRINRMEVPPGELARRQWRQARAAVRAGAGAWRNGAEVHVSDVGAPLGTGREPAVTS
jgi:nitrous oxide reductase